MKRFLILTVCFSLYACGGGSTVNEPVDPPAPLPPTPSNANPTANAGADQSVRSDDTVNLSGSGADSDGTIVSYEWTQINGLQVTIVSSNSQNASFTAPDVTSTEQLSFRLTVTDDDGATGADDILISVNPAGSNQSPVVDAGFDRTIFEETLVTLLGVVTDVDGTVDTYQWTQISGPSVHIFNPNAQVTTFDSPSVQQASVIEFRLTASDNEGAQSSNTVSFDVLPFSDTQNQVSRRVSRTVGVAPANVTFLAGFSSSSQTNSEFHELEYNWSFGENSSTTWRTSGRSKNTDKGPVATHLYTQPGTYVAQLEIRNASGIVDTESFEITILDPDVVFPSKNTICINSATSTDFSGCPSGSVQISTDNLSELSNHLKSGRRILFKRGDNWTLNSQLVPSTKAALIQIGAYGNCIQSGELDLCQNAPTIIINDGFLNVNQTHEVKITNLHFDGSNGATRGVAGGDTDTRRFLFSGIQTSGYSVPVGWSHSRGDEYDQLSENAIIGCLIEDFITYGVYIGGDYLTLKGNIIRNSETTHVARVWNAYLGDISHNILSGSSLSNTNGRQALKLHSPGEDRIGPYSETGASGLPHRTKFTMVSNNIIGASGPWPVSIGPQDDFSDERISDIIIEKNALISQYGANSAKLVSTPLSIAGRYFSVRNNMIDGTGGTRGFTGITVLQRGSEPAPLGVNISYNTIFNNDTLDNGTRGINIGNNVTDTKIENNLISFPSAVSLKRDIEDAGTNTLSLNNLLLDSPLFVDPLNSTPLLRDFRVQTGSGAIGQGDSNNVLDDFFGNYRATSGTTIGAAEHQ